MMKNFVLICLVIAVLWLGWKHFSSEPDVIVQTKTVVASERYGSELRNISDTIFSPLTGKTPIPISNIRRISGIVSSDSAHGRLNHSQARRILDLCVYLERLHAERENFEAGYRRIQSRDFGSLATRESDRRRNAAQSKLFFIDAHMRRWDEFVARERPRVQNYIEAIRALERNQEHSN